MREHPATVQAAVTAAIYEQNLRKRFSLRTGMGHENNELVPMEIDHYKPRNVCFQCNKLGHFAKNCMTQPRNNRNVKLIYEVKERSSIIFWNCNKPGHIKRKINQITKINSTPSAHIDDILALLGKASFFSNYDLKSGYWQLAIDSKDREKTAFTCHKGLFEFNVLPFGITSAPVVFMELMSRVLEGLEHFAKAYLDDILFLWRFIPNFSKIAEPFIELTKKYAKFNWSDACQKAFEYLKDSLTVVPFLAYPDTNKTYTLYCDPSDTCIGACLTQPCEDTEKKIYGVKSAEKPIYYLSHRLRTENTCADLLSRVPSKDGQNSETSEIEIKHKQLRLNIENEYDSDLNSEIFNQTTYIDYDSGIDNYDQSTDNDMSVNEIKLKPKRKRRVKHKSDTKQLISLYQSMIKTIVDLKGQFEIYQIYNLPLIMQSNISNQENHMIAQNQIETKALAMNVKKTKFVTLSDIEIQKCANPSVKYCNIRSAVYPIN
ncbi:unnamed protein product [Mytilus coruscus]|uniref:CCHC-type domain-containing protein n=1 Tax=Mytilus coruscus TaxID=42192 RepID=A0A6J8F287_MYTCO|nr:unnamed protein product [Mytilus coruscus]